MDGWIVGVSEPLRKLFLLPQSSAFGFFY